MAKRKTEPDSVYFLKLVMYLIFGSIWIQLSLFDVSVPLPVGLLAGLAFASHDHFQVDRKVEYAVLLVAAFVSYIVRTI